MIMKNGNIYLLKTITFSFILSGVYLMTACCSFVIPPVTLTGNKTAIEKQIIGEQNELEKDVWMISSAKTASRIDDSQLTDEQKQQEEKLRKENKYVNEAFLIMDLYSDNIAELKKDNVVGENNKGRLTNLIEVEKVKNALSEEIQKKYDPEMVDDIEKGKDYRNLVETIRQINHARDLLVKGYLSGKSKSKMTESEVVQIQKTQFHESALKGEYIQLPSGNWTQK